MNENEMDAGLKMLVGDTRRPLSDFWRHFNRQKENEWRQLEKKLRRLSFTKKLKLVSAINALIEEAAEGGKHV